MTDFIRVDMGPISPIPAGPMQGYLCLGNIPNALEIGKQLNKRFVAILNCTDDPALDNLNAFSGFEVLRLNHLDGEEYPDYKIKQGIDFIDTRLQTGSMVLVCCHAGLSRSPGMVLAYLLSKGYSYNESVHMIRKARPFIQIHPKIDLSVRKYFRLAPRTSADLIPASSTAGY